MATTAQINAIAALYVGYFNRAPDPAGLQFWIDQIENGREFETIAADFAASPEATALYPYLTAPDVASSSVFITSIYQNLFNRMPDAEGLEFWSDVLDSGSVSVADMIAAIIEGAVDSPDATPPTLDATTLDNKVEAGLDFAADAANASGFDIDDAADKSAAIAAVDDVTDDEATVDAAKAATDAFLSGANNEGDTFDLAVGPDNIVGTAANDTINALPVDEDGSLDTTFGLFDKIDGGAGTDTLNITVASGRNSSFSSTAEVKNVEVVNIEWLTGASNSSLLDVSNYEGVEQLWQINASGDVDEATGDVTLGFRDIDSSRLNDDIYVATGETTVNIALDNSYGRLDTNGATSVNVSGTKDDAGDFTLRVNNTGTATGVAVNTAVATSLAVNTSAVTTVDASASTGDIAYTTSADVAVSTGSGDDTVTIDTLGANASVDLGAGDDTLLDNGAAASASGSYDGGEGTDSVSSALINAGNGAKFLNFENLSLAGTTGAGLDLDLLTGSTITGLSIDKAANSRVLNATTDQSLTVNANGGLSVIEFADVDGDADAYAINFAGENGVNAGAVTIDGIESVTIDSTSETDTGSNAIGLDGDALETVTISGEQDLSITFSGATSNLTSIDGSAAAGDLNVAVNVADVAVMGGAGDDTIVVGDKATVTTGAGADDIDVSGTLDTAEMVTITDFGAGDKISFNDAATFTAAATDVSSATNLNKAIELADSANGTVSWFQYGNNTYVVDSGTTTGVDFSDDAIVKLTGLIDLSSSTLASNELTFA